MASGHTRTSSTASEILITETVSSLQRCMFGNIFRSQRQLMRFAVCLGIFLLAVYMLNPFSSSEKVIPDSEHKNAPAVRSVHEEEKSVSEYRATYFEEMGKRFAEKEDAAKGDSFHFSNALGRDEEKMRGVEGKKDVKTSKELAEIAQKVRKTAMVVSKCKEVPGLSMVLVKGGSSENIPLGMADIAAGHPVTKDTSFLLNSISKTFLAQLVAVLISDSSKNITWDTRVADILGPDFQLATEELTKEVTLRDLLSHRSGLSSGNLAVRATYPAGWTRAQLVRNFKHLPPSAPFRKTFLYSNLCGTLAAHVAEVIGGAPWEELIVNKLLAPLGMLNTRPMTSYKQLERNDFSRQYVPVEGTLTAADLKIFDMGPLAPVGLLGTTATDITKWLQFNLRQGVLPDGKPLIRRDVWSSMWHKQTDLSPMFLAGIDKSGNQWPVKDVSEGYGLSWFINKYRGLTNFWHGGGLYSHYTLAWHFPEKDVALYTVINGYSGDSRPFSIMESLAYYAADLLLGYQPWLNEDTLCSFPDLSGKPSSLPNQTKQAGEGQGAQGKDDKGRQEKEVHAEQLRGQKDRVMLPDNAHKHSGGEKHEEGERTGPKLPLQSYQGLYHCPLFGNFSVFINHQSETPHLECQMNILTGILHHLTDHTFGVEITHSLRFLSKPSKTVPAKNAFQLTFLEDKPGQISAVNIHSSWAMEVPLRFQKIR